MISTGSLVRLLDGSEGVAEPLRDDPPKIWFTDDGSVATVRVGPYARQPRRMVLESDVDEVLDENEVELIETLPRTMNAHRPAVDAVAPVQRLQAVLGTFPMGR